MAKMTPEERAEIEARLQADDNEPDDDDFEIEIYSPEGHGSRLPYSKGRAYLQQHFGIDVGDIPATGGGAGNAGKGGNGKGAPGTPDPSSASSSRASQRYFGGRSKGAADPNSGGTPNPNVSS